MITRAVPEQVTAYELVARQVRDAIAGPATSPGLS
jgi:hypothetical protein